jgi:preprotein translocase subunit SecF
VSDRGVLTRLYNGETNIEFIGRAKIWFALSALVILAGLAALFARGLNLGIDFEGGVSWEAPAGQASEDSIRTCEVCGAPGVLEERQAWWSPRCEAHKTWTPHDERS